MRRREGLWSVKGRPRRARSERGGRNHDGALRGEVRATNASAKLVRLLSRNLPGWSLVRVATRTNRVLHHTGAFLRILLRKGSRRKACLVVYPGTPAHLVDRMWASLVLWFDQLGGWLGAVEMEAFVPVSWPQRCCRPLEYLRLPVRLRGYDLRTGSIRPAEMDSFSSGLDEPYVLFDNRPAAPKVLTEIARQLPGLQLVFRHGRWELSCRGFPIAWEREAAPGVCDFDLADPRPVCPDSSSDVMRHVQEVIRLRREPAPQPSSIFFRAFPERWLESSFLAYLDQNSAEFPGPVYAQVPSRIDGSRKVIDLLSCDLTGQLVVFELKVAKSLELPFQALDYWDRVRLHLERDDWHRAGYFPNRNLSRKEPLICLVSPLFDYHRLMPVYRKYLSVDVPMLCWGVNSNWRENFEILRKSKAGGT